MKDYKIRRVFLPFKIGRFRKVRKILWEIKLFNRKFEIVEVFEKEIKEKTVASAILTIFPKK